MEDYGSFDVDAWVRRPSDPVVYPDVYYQQGDSAGATASEAYVAGTSNSPPLVSSEPQVAGQAGDVFDDVSGAIKKFGQVASQVVDLARQAGQAVGAIERGANSAQGAFEAGRADGKRYMAARAWWDTTSTTDKVMIGLAVAGLAYALTHKGA